MSMPTIPDITPDIDICFDKAVNLLLASIATEEISLSKLMNAETDEIKYVLEKQKCKRGDLDNVLSVNSSVNTTLMNMAKIQMLLQWKLENAEPLLHKHSPCLPKPPCPPQPPCPPPQKCCCSVTGKGRGCIGNAHNRFRGAEAILRAAILSCDKEKNNSLTYKVAKENAIFSMNADSNDLCVKCPTECGSHMIEITGNGKAKRTCECGEAVMGDVKFRLVRCVI